jgi:hypothetical protein
MELSSQYAAGLFDGEGTILIAKSDRTKYRPNGTPLYNLRASLGSQNVVVLEMLQEKYGGWIYRRQGVHTWILTTKNAAAFLEDVIPYLVIKQEQAFIGLQFQKISSSRSTNRKTDEEIRIYDRLKAEISFLNNEDSNAFHSKSGEFMGTPLGDNHEPSQGNDTEVPWKVQRLGSEESTNNLPTSARHESEDIVRTIQ